MKAGRLKRIAPIALLLTIPAYLGFAQMPTQTVGVTSRFTGGTLTEVIPVPPGVTGATITAKDVDPVWDDTLMGPKSVGVTPGGNLVAKMQWICVEGNVTGPDGGSGEGCAEAVFCVTWSDGSTYEGPEHELCCPD